ncbi:AraC family transcriptional regulator [Dactylosporangium fulvum]|uniref:AraC family transcriptional regulator n=1 Tax=Dactylosporangium fulvum TaxID=53359 RepID=A0ABY5VP12_9ACTN|nr:AraC family transcriptional regulator [Dactylosporangium fulvum]UWP78829.1 AraC family transcriptional regulator [Dactylosporangium fulvum]
MDVLSDVIAVMRAGRPVSTRLAWRAPWGQRFASVPGAAGVQVILRGSCWLLPDAADPVPLGAGDVLFMAHGQGHALADDPATPPRPCDPELRAEPFTGEPDGVTLCGAYELDPAHTHPLLLDLPGLIHLPAHLERSPELRATVDLLAAELERPRPGTDALVPALLDMLLLYVLRTWLDTHPARGWATALRDPAVGAALQAVHRDPAAPWTVASLAAVAGLSRAPFARRFTALVGQPPLAYLTWWRMTTAARLLRRSDAPLSAIADRVGYTSEFAFAAAFKRRFGTAPGRFRRAGQAAEAAPSTERPGPPFHAGTRLICA